MSSDKKNDVIKFPGSKVVSEPDSKGAGEDSSASNNVINRVDSNFWATKGRLSGDGEEKPSAEIKPAGNELNPLSKSSSAQDNVVKFSSPAPLPAQAPGKESHEGAQAKQSHYAVAGTAVALCFMVAGLVTLNRQNGPGGSDRVLATQEKSGTMPIITKADGSKHTAWFYEDADNRPAVMLKEQSATTRDPDSFAKQSFVTKVKKFFVGDTKKTVEGQKIKQKRGLDKDSSVSGEKRLSLLLKQREQKMLDLIKSGQRRLASIGIKPAIRDVFSIQVLKSRYDTRWKRGKLVYAVLLEDREPVYLPSTDKVVNEYEALFPSYAHIKKLSTVSNDLEIYELRDTDGSHTAEVETLRDINGKLLSIHVVSD